LYNQTTKRNEVMTKQNKKKKSNAMFLVYGSIAGAIAFAIFIVILRKMYA